ncbi:Carboxylesterase type B [Gemmatirosa kalamazoonensis]|uniref:Carboxylic ester hydrolase n=1 Tax=Gemmatirosa kalamazoonensis TaxID=861299 RepID=W0REC4_9BACT|nr:carboxylesterase family protein [Gemmatirosa kalamazoonensis]AHG89459.1 Carboxylesterase type B [Gemmatirosa kalamazoonensis]
MHTVLPGGRRSWLRLAAAATVLSSHTFAAGAQTRTGAPVVRTTGGAVQGLALSSGVRAFRGIPFAAPPVRELRWKPPQPAATWQGVRLADRFADQCMQARIYSDMMFRNAGVSEDCLYLNVWAPADARPNAALPVLVYFYGGGFQAGDGSELRYDGESMAKRGIVVVTMSYRLGVFGFFSHPELTAESPQHASGDYGLMDQTAALRWVRDNVARFGGDPAKVTIAGESAGSMSVSAQMASPMAKGLFARAIGESGAVFSSSGPMATRARTEENGVRFAQAVGAPSLAALRALSATELLEMAGRQGMPRFGVNVDGYFFPQPPAEIYAAGKQARVPLLAGWNTEESSWRSLTAQSPTPDSARAVLARVFGERAGDAAQVYPAGSAAEATQSLVDLASDRFIAYSTWKWLDTHAATSAQPVYRYLYARPRPGAHGAVHSAEIEYALGNLATNHAYAWTPDDEKVSAAMQAYFANFIKTGDPNGAGLPAWPVGTAGPNGEVQRLRIDVEPHAEAEPRARYRFLERAFTSAQP